MQRLFHRHRAAADAVPGPQRIAIRRMEARAFSRPRRGPHFRCGYLHRWNDLEMLDGVAETIAAFNEAGWFVFVVTNQAGVARGFYEEGAIALLHDQIRDWLAVRGAHVDAFYYCPYHPEATVEAYRMDHPDRKPRPGMLLRAMEEWPVIARQAILVGRTRKLISRPPRPAGAGRQAVPRW